MSRVFDNCCWFIPLSIRRPTNDCTYRRYREKMCAYCRVAEKRSLGFDQLMRAVIAVRKAHGLKTGTELEDDDEAVEWTLDNYWSEIVAKVDQRDLHKFLNRGSR